VLASSVVETTQDMRLLAHRRAVHTWNYCFRRCAIADCDSMRSRSHNGDGGAEVATSGPHLCAQSLSYGMFSRLNMWIFIFHVPSFCFSKILTVWPAMRVLSPVSRTSWTVFLVT
jgi:hypothetical protein